MKKAIFDTDTDERSQDKSLFGYFVVAGLSALFVLMLLAGIPFLIGS